MDEAAALFRPFKFAFAMDNSAKEGALSEKLANAYFGQSIPLFYGGVDIPTELNQRAFVYCNISYDSSWEAPVWKKMSEKTGWISAYGQMSHDEMVRADEEHNLTAVRLEHLLTVKEMVSSAMPCVRQIMQVLHIMLYSIHMRMPHSSTRKLTCTYMPPRSLHTHALPRSLHTHTHCLAATFLSARSG
jgi:hypothetical protein